MRDGTALLADHYAPVVPGPSPTILMRGPYGRGWQLGLLNAQIFAERGYHVLLQSTRGTFGSGGLFRPAADEPHDAHDTVVWLREQDWFDGRLATVGSSYLGFTQWALALDPPPELAASVVTVGLHDIGRAAYEQGPLELYNTLMWAELLSHQERNSTLSGITRMIRTERRLAPALARRPLRGVLASLGEHGSPWYEEWLAHPDLDAPYWQPLRATDALHGITAPTLLIGGWYDAFLTQTLDQYDLLRGRGVDTALVMGSWTHVNIDPKVVLPHTLAWLDEHVAHRAPATSRLRGALVHVGGANRWDHTPTWPPDSTGVRTWHLQPAGSLTETPPGPDGATTTLHHDPADPTPSPGGRLMAFGGGPQDNQDTEAREDVVTFTTPPLAQPVEIHGAPVLDIHLASDNPEADLFARLCDVHPDGRSISITDRIVRLTPKDTQPDQTRIVRITLDPTAYHLRPGHRLRLQLAGGAHPRFAGNPGTGETATTSAHTRPVTHTIHHDQAHLSRLTVPAVPLPLDLPPEQVQGQVQGQ
ncbi:CocE/NonD family hydrolase [Streptomyces sp. NPDC057137]|uniref:CocE/NonD family hydrolase n=1 Tax=Streptomyces sp. NPDC057137 TaxID=3346030 RepID=UPI00363AC4FE